MILFCAPDLDRPSGGVRTMYRAVDLLNGAGMNAAVLHARPGFRCTWFPNTTRVDHPPVTVGGHDVLVVPEAVTLVDLDRLAPGVPKVLFNQGAYRTFHSATRRGGLVVASAADHPDVVTVLVVSEDSRALLERALPQAHVVRMHHWIDSSVFHPGPARREHRIVAIPRKRPADFQLLVDILRARSALGDWELSTLGHQSEADFAIELRRAALFVALAHADGFGLPTAEALASGCPVVGFHGMGGRELFRSEFAVAVEDGDVGALAAWIERFVAEYDAQHDAWGRRGAEAVEFVRSVYSRERATNDLVACFGAVAPRTGTAPTVVTRRDLPRPSLGTRARTRVIELGRRFVSPPTV